jgi:hypothetical protein
VDANFSDARIRKQVCEAKREIDVSRKGKEKDLAASAQESGFAENLSVQIEEEEDEKKEEKGGEDVEEEGEEEEDEEKEEEEVEEEQEEGEEEEEKEEEEEGEEKQEEVEGDEGGEAEVTLTEEQNFGMAQSKFKEPPSFWEKRVKTQ